MLSRKLVNLCSFAKGYILVLRGAPWETEV